MRTSKKKLIIKRKAENAQSAAAKQVVELRYNYFWIRFICLKKLNKNNADCADFETRFCCPKSYNASSNTNLTLQKPEKYAITNRKRREEFDLTSQEFNATSEETLNSGPQTNNSWSNELPNSIQELRKFINKVNFPEIIQHILYTIFE